MANGGPGSVLLGDRLVWTIYQAIRNSKSQKGNNWSNTLLITFDEHGGCFDHVAPPAATSPDPADFNTGAGEEGFDFRRLGVRVPVVMVSRADRTEHYHEYHDGPLLVPENSSVQVELEFARPAPGHCHAFYRGVL
jgi:phospholipase C